MTPRAFERPATIALPPGVVGEGAALEGLFVPGPDSDGAGAVIAPPHPLMGGSMDSPVVTELAFACERAGIASLRFNWRGVGASAGRPSGDESAADEDYAASLAFLRETVGGPLYACGYSFGSAAALRSVARSPRPRRVVLVAPPLVMLSPDLLAGFDGDVIAIAGERDEWVDCDALERLAEPLPRVTVARLPDCDHFFVTGLGALRRELDAWLDRLG